MGHQPAVIGAVAGKAAPQLVIYAALGHIAEGVGDPIQQGVLPGTRVFMQKKIKHLHGREFRRPADPAKARLILFGQQAHALFQHIVSGQSGREARGPGHAFKGFVQTVDVPRQFILAVMVNIRHYRQQLFKSRTPVTILRREIGSAEVRLLLRRHKHRHRPAAAAGGHLHKGHIKLIQIGPFLPVHLDADEVGVHQGGDLFVLKGFVFHHMAPVAGGIADAQQDGLVLRPRPFQRLLAPGIPVHRVIGMLQQIGAGFVFQMIQERLLFLPAVPDAVFIRTGAKG